ncbi:AHH domain-containing protein [Pyxidicoccus xibeiensis]|uniref:AHH domain-containing protein n=1 Tax=Pyxidicoccus xibeiensis TaxID=2906759 RepID=UPI0020A7568A|nr:AHH domain-containing protein [Pyxidicoccus xibeiensis]MCP3143121.1 AHH domain-containing protein [Pyxidicoccus xibeiensis]
MQTAAAMRRSERIEKDYARKKAKFTASQKRAKAKKKKKGAAKKPAHASTLADLKGVLAKDAYYGQNCHDYLETDGGRNALFKNFDVDFAHKHTGVPKKVLEAFRFPNPDHVENFNPGAKDVGNPKKKAGQKYPYVWEAHHMLPGSAFYYEDDEGLCFENWQLTLILQSDYNLNHGHNMIPLADETWAVPIHKLPQHPGDHPIYTQLVMRKLRQVAKRLERARDKGAKHPDLKAEVFQKLRELEDESWDFLVDLGKTLTKALVASRRHTAPWVTYGTAKDPLKYEWGALY